MNRDLVWLVCVLLLGGSILVIVNSEDETNPNFIDIQELTCPLGEVLVSNTSLAEGYECIPFDPHTISHTHPVPVLTVTDVVDDGSTVVVTGSVNHQHPDEITVLADQGVSISPVITQPNLNGAWSLILQNNAEKVYINITASHDLEQTFSETTLIEINRTSTDESNNTNNGVDDGTENNTDNQTQNNTGNDTDNGNDNGSESNSGNESDNGNEEVSGPTQPTYDSSDMGQFWLDVFRCQTGQNITQVDDLTTTAVETHECSVSITMNETHITIVTNGLPDHDFESTLACSQANDCTRAQDYEWTIPRSPVNDTTGGHDSTNCPEANGDYECAAALGEVAIAINGVPFYGPEDGPGGDAVASHHGVYQEDRQPIELGVCHAHNGQGGTFHYHADANCLHWHPDEGETMLDYDISTPAAVAQNTANGSHSAVIGVAMDGYPIYGLWGYDDQMNVVEMRSSYQLKEGETGYNGIDDYVYVQGLGHLDVCNGHFGPTPEFPDGIYHYHSTMMNGEGDMGFPYFLLCYHGETFLDEAGGSGTDCSGYGETWGPGIGPPPEGCGGGGPGAQLENVELVSSQTIFSPYSLMLILLMVSAMIWRWGK
ncbi:YHYH protein [Euryarchaeota archaeon]|nr:YHYH protein [Euryarchaeota archaeon]